MKILVIPDIHLKPFMIDRADAVMKKLSEKENLAADDKKQKTGAVFLGDLADDWGRQDDVEAYREIYDRCIAFVKKYEDVYFCIGNHDISYVWEKEESGYSYNPEVQAMVRRKMKELKEAFSDQSRFAYVHCIDNVIFSHAGLGIRYIRKFAGAGGSLDGLIWRSNNSFGPEELWRDTSPIWARMQKEWFQNDDAYSGGRLQVVGHTPVEEAIYDEEDLLLSTDTFSTDPTGAPLGNQKFIVVDTVGKTFEYI